MKFRDLIETSASFIKHTAKDYGVSVDVVKDILKKVDNNKAKMYSELEDIVKNRK